MRSRPGAADPGVGPAVRVSPPNEIDCLHSWKEIAAYLKRGVRTVQRWEETEGLPVHRHAHERRDSVYAYPPELDAWWTRHLGGLPVPAKPQPVGWWRRRRMIIGIALAVLAVAVAVGTAVLHRSPALSFGKRDWVLVADFDNRTGEPVFDQSLAAAFTVSLEQSPHANVLPRSRIRSALQRMGKGGESKIDGPLGREICLREHVKGLIACGITKAGREYLLSARLVDPESGAAVRSYLEEARDRDHIIGALGKLTARIRRDLGESLGSIRQNDDPLPLVTTSSLEALRLFSEGNYLWRKGDYHAAIRAYEAALQHDPDFAMAHEALGSAFMSFQFNDTVRGKEHFEKALRRADRITDRERLHLQATYQHSLSHVWEAIQAYRLYLNTYPDDSEARFDLGVLLMHATRYEEAIAEFQQVVRLDRGHARAWLDLATSYGGLDRARESLAYYAKAFELEPGWITLGNFNHEYGFRFVYLGDFARARQIFELALRKPEMKTAALRSLALLDMYQGKFREARPLLEQAIDINRTEAEPLTEARNHLYLSILLSRAGDRAGRLRELDRASQAMALWSNPALWLRAWIGAGYAQAGAVAKAESILRAISSHVDPGNAVDVSDLRLLEGEVALARGNFPRAIENLSLAADGVHLPVGLGGLCPAYQKSGHVEQAIACYEKLISLGFRSIQWEPQQDWIHAHAALAELYLSRGERRKAEERLSALAGLWKEADADLPLVIRIAELKQRLAH